MRICRVSRSMPPLNIGGLENHVYELSRSQSVVGHQVHIVIPYFSIIQKGPFNIHLVKITGIKPIADETFLTRLSVFLRIMIFEFLAFFKVMWLDRTYKYTLFHVHGDWFMAIFSAFLRLILRKPVVITIHSSLKGGIWSKLGRLGIIPFLVVNRIIVVSKEIKKELINAGVPAYRIYVISSGVRLSHFYKVKKSYIKKDSPVILFIGRIRRVKGVRILIKAFSLVLEQFPKSRLLIVGDGPSKVELEGVSMQMGLEKNISFLGTIPHNFIPKYLSMADIFVLPSIETSREKGEGRPTALIEAMVAGVPVVASRIGGIPEIIKHGENGLLVKPGGYVEIADSIIKVLSNPSFASQLGFKASETATEYDWRKIAENVCEVYSKICRDSEL